MQKRNAGMMLASALTVLLGSNFAGPVYAAQIDASLIPEYDVGAGSFTGTKFIQITYQPGSEASKLFDGRTERVEFSIKGTNSSGMAELVRAINGALSSVESPVQVSNANLTYSGVLRGGPDRLSLTYKVELVQEFTGFSLNKTALDDIPMDINWRGFALEGPVYVESAQHGRININQPIGLLEVTFPEFAGKLVETDAKIIMTEPILDFQEISDRSMDRWHVLFDPTISLASTRGILSGDIGRAKVLSVYSLGECSIREGCPPPKEGDANATVDGSALKVHISTPQPNSQIEIAGYSSLEQAGSHQIVRVAMDNPNFAIPGFTLQVLLVLGGMMGAIAIFVLSKSRK